MYVNNSAACSDAVSPLLRLIGGGKPAKTIIETTNQETTKEMRRCYERMEGLNAIFSENNQNQH